MSENKCLKEKVESWFKRRFTKEVDIISANEAYNYANFGCQMSEPERIKVCQSSINSLIKYKSKPDIYNGNEFGSCHCVYVVPEDVSEFSEEIFKPFVETGFIVRKLSEYIKDVDEPHLFLISWNKAK